MNRDNIKLQFVFTSPSFDKKGGPVVIQHFMSLKHTRSENGLRQALNDWYGQKKKDHGTWSLTHPVEHMNGGHEALAKHREWANMADVQATPTIFINGQRLPKAYQPEDLKYVL